MRAKGSIKVKECPEALGTEPILCKELLAEKNQMEKISVLF